MHKFTAEQEHQAVAMSDDKTPTSAREQSASLPMACTQPCAALELLGEKLAIAITRIELCTADLERVREAAEQAKEAAQNAADGALAAVQSREPLSRKERFSTTFLGSVVGGAVVAATIMVASSAAAHLSGFFDPRAQAAPDTVWQMPAAEHQARSPK